MKTIIILICIPLMITLVVFGIGIVLISKSSFFEKVYMFIFYHQDYIIFKQIEKEGIQHNWIAELPPPIYKPSDFIAFKDQFYKRIIYKDSTNVCFYESCYPLCFKELTKDLDLDHVW